MNVEIISLPQFPDRIRVSANCGANRNDNTIRYDPWSMANGLKRIDNTDTEVDIRAIDDLLARGLTLLRLPAALERRFLHDHTSRRMRLMMGSGVLVSFMFNWLLVADAVMIPDQFDQALKLRLLVFTPLVLLGLMLVSRMPSTTVREGMIFVSSLLAVGVNVHLCMSSQAPTAGPYLVSLASIVVFSNTVARVRFGLAALLDLIAFALFVWAAMSIPSAPFEVMLPAGVLLLSLSVFTLYGCFSLEMEERRTWLIRLREQRMREALVEANERLEQASRHDALTDLPNRHHFEDAMATAWSQAQQRSQPVSMVLLDVDRLQRYNNRMGQAEGDACLRLLAATLKRCNTQGQAFIARYGGEEFALLLQGVSVHEAAALAQRIRQAVIDLHLPHPDGVAQRVTVSAGVASIRADAPHATQAQLMAAADEALRQAKQQGGNSVFAFGTEG